jgi:cyclic pyranopterin phosphate synthase
MPEEGVEPCAHSDILRYEEIERLVAFLKGHFNLTKVRITGGDPLVRANIETLVSMLSRMQIPDLALTTNAQVLESRAERLKEAGLHRVNISLDSLHSDTFHRLTRGGELQRTIDGIRAAVRHGLTPVKLNMVVMRGVNDSEVKSMLAFALSEGCELRFLELMPAGMDRHEFDRHYVSCTEICSALSPEFTIRPHAPRPGSTSRLHDAESPSHGRGRFGVITPTSHPFCSDCRRLRLTSDGYLVGCLARQKRVQVRPLLAEDAVGREEALALAVQEAMGHKREDHVFEAPASMARIGG